MSDDIFDSVFISFMMLFGFFCGIAVSILVMTFMGIEEPFLWIFFGIMMGIVGSIALTIGIVQFLYLFKIVRRE